VDEVIERGEPRPRFDTYARLMSLPGILGTRLETVPASVPYLRGTGILPVSNSGIIENATGFKVGIAWQGNPEFKADRSRSIPLSAFAPLARIDGVSLFSLQRGTGVEQIASRETAFDLIEFDPPLDAGDDAFIETAAVMEQLDLVITSDTSIAHLAGALGVWVWVALSHRPDWRWLRDRADCPWYPTMRLFRQDGTGDWEAVFAQIAEALRQEVVARPGDARASHRVVAPLSPGELLDRITILELKANRVACARKRQNVQRELHALRQARGRLPIEDGRLETALGELRQVNAALWQTEDELRLCERDRQFGPRFVELARSVYLQNDRRACLKRQIDLLLGSDLVAEKEYAGEATRG
jgi:hypothetical protein